MGYMHKRHRAHRKGRPLSGLGDVLSNIFGAVGAVSTAVSDPYFPETVCRIEQIQAADAGKAVPACTPTASDQSTALGRLVVPLRMVAYAEQNKWVYPLAIAAIIGVPLWIGYEIGSSKKRGA